MTFVRLVVLTLTLFCAVAGTAAGAVAVPTIERVPDPISALVRDYARAWQTKDAGLLRRTVGGKLLASEQKALQNAREVPFSEVTMRVSTQYSGDLASGRVDALYRGRQARTYHVVEETRIANETDAFAEDAVFTFVRDESVEGYDGWRLVSKSDLDILGFFSPYHLWDEAPVTVLRSARFILLTHPDVVDVMRPVLTVAEQAYDRVDDFWPGPQRDRYVIIAPSTTEELGRIMHETIDLGKFVAFVSAGADRREGWVPTGPRMFVHLSHLRTYERAAQTEIVAHELIHAVTREASGPQMPTWVEEGLANLGGGTGGRQSVATEGPTPADFPSDDRFVVGPVRGIQTVYDQSQVAIEALVDEFGVEGLARFYSELGSARVTPGTEDHHVRRAIKESVGWSYEEWVAAWRRRLG